MLNLLERLREMRRTSTGELGVIALLGVAVVTAGAFVFMRTSAPKEPEIRKVVSISSAKASPTPAAPVVVHVAGAVLSPGVYDLPKGARVRDAVQAAGGAAGEADLNSMNLAARVNDGQKIYLAVKGEVAPGMQASAGEQFVAGSTPAEGGKVNLNTSGSAQLEDLPGIGPVLAQRIVEYRTKHNGFRSIRDLLEVDGFGPKRYESLKDLVTT